MGITKNRLGEIGKTNEGYEIKIVEYNNANDITIEFQDKYKARVHTLYKHFKNGNIKNPYHPSVCNIGYLGTGKYNTTEHRKIWDTWHDMLKRCYDEKNYEKHPTYIDCSVYEEWHNFQKFAKWYEENYYEIKDEKIHLDKDILVKGNKIYSPQMCVFVPDKINLLFAKSNNTRGKYPIGVSYHSRYNYLIVRCNTLGKTVFLGHFSLDEPFKAFTTYKNFKENYIKKVADEYKELIPQKLYEVLYKYEVEIND